MAYVAICDRCDDLPVVHITLHNRAYMMGHIKLCEECFDSPYVRIDKIIRAIKKEARDDNLRVIAKADNVCVEHNADESYRSMCLRVLALSAQ